MLHLNASSIGIQQGSRVLFSDFVNDGPMWAGQGDRIVRTPIAFTKAFLQKPAVHASIGMCDMDHKHNIRADLTVEDVTATGFVAVFATWADSRIARVRVDWMAIGAVESEDNWQLY